MCDIGPKPSILSPQCNCLAAFECPNYLRLERYYWMLKLCREEPPFGSIVAGVYTPLLARDSESEGPQVCWQEFRQTGLVTPKGLRMLLDAFRVGNPLGRIVADS